MYDGTELLGMKNWKNIVCLFVREPFFWKSWGVNLSGRENLKLQFLGKIINFTYIPDEKNKKNTIAKWKNPPKLPKMVGGIL